MKKLPGPLNKPAFRPKSQIFEVGYKLLSFVTTQYINVELLTADKK